MPNDGIENVDLVPEQMMHLSEVDAFRWLRGNSRGEQTELLSSYAALHPDISCYRNSHRAVCHTLSTS